MFADAAVARRIEAAEVGLILEGVRASARRLPPGQPIIVEMNGGAVVYTEPGAPFNKAVGFGFGGVPPVEALAEVEAEFAARGAALQFEVANLGDPAVPRMLTARGYALVGFENVLGRPVSIESSPPVSGVAVKEATPDETRLWLDTVLEGFLHPDTFDGPASHESFDRDVLARIFEDTVAAPGFERFVALIEGTIAGGASFRIQDGVAQLSGAATLPNFRRRGVQSALLQHRLQEAARRGSDLAVVTTQPGSKSQQNVQKAGFALLYTRAVLVKEPASQELGARS